MAPNSPSRHLLKTALGLLSKDKPKSIPWHRLSPFRLLTYAYLSLLSFRFLFLSLALHNPYRFSDYLTLDPSMSHFANLFSHQYIITLACIPATFFILAEDYLLCVRPNAFYWTLEREMLITNSHQFWQLNNEHLNFPPFNWRHPFQSILIFKTQFLTIWNCEKTAFSLFKLPSFLELSCKERTRIVLLELFWSKVELWILLALALIETIPFIDAFLTLFQILPILKLTIFLFDLIILYLIFLQLSYHLLFRLFLMLLDDYVSRQTGRRLAAYLRSIWKRLQSGRHQNFGLITKQLAFYRGAHWRLLKLALRLNVTFVSPLFFVIFLTNFPISICFQAALFQPDISRANRLLILAILVEQLSVSILTIERMCARFSTIYESTSCLHLILQALSGRLNIREKWKVSLYYEQLHSGERFSFTAGPFGRVSKQSFASLIFMDLAYVMQISNMMLET